MKHRKIFYAIVCLIILIALVVIIVQKKYKIENFGKDEKIDYDYTSLDESEVFEKYSHDMIFGFKYSYNVPGDVAKYSRKIDNLDTDSENENEEKSDSSSETPTKRDDNLSVLRSIEELNDMSAENLTDNKYNFTKDELKNIVLDIYISNCLWDKTTNLERVISKCTIRLSDSLIKKVEIENTDDRVKFYDLNKNEKNVFYNGESFYVSFLTGVGYEDTKYTMYITFQYNGKTYKVKKTLQCFNEGANPKKADVTLMSVDKDTNRLQIGQEFNIINLNSNEETYFRARGFKTGSDGKIVLKYLPLGTYKVQKVQNGNIISEKLFVLTEGLDNPVFAF